MKLNKNALALAVATAAMSSAAVQAGTWAPAGGATAVEYAAELFGASNTTTLTARTARYTLAAVVAAGSQIVDVSLTNATFATAAPERGPWAGGA